jgi:hypothetical protein
MHRTIEAPNKQEKGEQKTAHGDLHYLDVCARKHIICLSEVPFWAAVSNCTNRK